MFLVGLCFCAFLATFKLVTEFVKDIKDKYGRKRNKNVGQNLNLTRGLGLVSGQSYK